MTRYKQQQPPKTGNSCILYGQKSTTQTLIPNGISSESETKTHFSNQSERSCEAQAWWWNLASQSRRFHLPLEHWHWHIGHSIHTLAQSCSIRETRKNVLFYWRAHWSCPKTNQTWPFGIRHTETDRPGQTTNTPLGCALHAPLTNPGVHHSWKMIVRVGVYSLDSNIHCVCSLS